MPKAKTKTRKSNAARQRPRSAITAIERGLKTRILSSLMLILASSLGFWFFGFAPWALAAWVLSVVVGGYIIFEFDLTVSKSIVVLAALVMQFFVLEGAVDLLVIGSSTNLMLMTFGLLDLILIYALLKI